MIKSIFVIILGVLIAGAAYAQIDEKRMDRDIKVAAGALNSLSMEGSEGPTYVVWGNDVKGSYVEDYGVIFYVPRNTYLVGWAPRVSVGRSINRSGNVSVVAPITSSGSVVDSDGEKKSLKEQVEERKEIYKTFLADYGLVIGQLSAGQKIMVTEKSNNSREQLYVDVSRPYILGDREDEVDKEIDSQISAEIAVSDIDAFKLGKLSRDQLLGKVDITLTVKSNEVVRDFEIFANMIKTVFSSELTESYWTSWKPRYHQLENVGVVFSMEVYSSYTEDQGYRMPSLGINNIKESERNDKVKELYPKFIEDLKSSIVDYGRTLKSVKDDELVMFKVKMTKCEGCGLPENLEISIKMSVLNNYATGKLSRAQAIQAVKVKDKA